jgi:uncharacterized protein (TIRG00374 family)
MVVFLIGFWLVVGRSPSGDSQTISSLWLGGVLGLALSLVALVSMFLFARYPERAMAVARWFLRAAPGRLRPKIEIFLDTFRTGLGVLVHGSSVAKALLLSALLWLAICLSFWLVAVALDVHFGFGDTFLVIGFLTVGIAVPTPGGIGGYHYMCSLALTTLFGVDPSPAAAVALVAHAISFLPVTFLGILLFVKAGLTFAQFGLESREPERRAPQARERSHQPRAVGVGPQRTE